MASQPFLLFEVFFSVATEKCFDRSFNASCRKDALLYLNNTKHSEALGARNTRRRQQPYTVTFKKVLLREKYAWNKMLKSSNIDGNAESGNIF